jgi:hypothetical protein
MLSKRWNRFYVCSVSACYNFRKVPQNPKLKRNFRVQIIEISKNRQGSHLIGPKWTFYKNIFKTFGGKLPLFFIYYLSLSEHTYNICIYNSSRTASCCLHRFRSVEGLLWGAEPRFKLGPALQQADALLIVPGRTLMPRRTLSATPHPVCHAAP